MQWFALAQRATKREKMTKSNSIFHQFLFDFLFHLYSLFFLPLSSLFPFPLPLHSASFPLSFSYPPSAIWPDFFSPEPGGTSVTLVFDRNSAIVSLLAFVALLVYLRRRRSEELELARALQTYVRSHTPSLLGDSTGGEVCVV